MKLYLHEDEPDEYLDNDDYPMIILMDDGELYIASNVMDGAYVLQMRKFGIHIRGNQNDLGNHFRLSPVGFHMEVCDHERTILTSNQDDHALCRCLSETMSLMEGMLI